MYLIQMPVNMQGKRLDHGTNTLSAKVKWGSLVLNPPLKSGNDPVTKKIGIEEIRIGLQVCAQKLLFMETFIVVGDTLGAELKRGV
ncbi:MAG TPA: hypothetical protein PLH64_05910 [Anaerolineaceae bacterium]|nr:hypothetical protein [Anaerolineaceae bacterium]